jgi:hypothetical protein
MPSNGRPEQADRDGQPARATWVRNHFTEIFGISADDLRRQGINPRQYANGHRDEIRQFARVQRDQGLHVPRGRAAGNPQPNNGQAAEGQTTTPSDQERRDRRSGFGMRGGTAWIGILIALLALRFLIVDTVKGTHIAVFWVIGIGGIMLVARVLLFSWLRRRRFNRR